MRRAIRSAVTLVIVSLLVLIAACAPIPGEVTPTPTPSPEPAPAPSPQPEVNFRLLISDDVNAIGDFASLNVTISSVGVHKGGEPGEWLEFPPATEELDLVLLQGENAQEIWSGNLSDGEYNKVFIYVTDINGVLKTGEPAENIKLPSEKLHINTHFSIPEDSPVSFVFDLTVVAAGNEKSGVKYILKPVISESGPKQKFNEVTESEGSEDSEDMEGGEEAEDTTPPVITLTGVTDGQVVTAPDTVTPVFSVSDDTDLTPTVTAKLNGEPFTSGTEISEVGEYELEITAKDASDNEAEVKVNFEIVPAEEEEPGEEAE